MITYIYFAISAIATDLLFLPEQYCQVNLCKFRFSPAQSMALNTDVLL